MHTMPRDFAVITER